jgi:4-hydroxy-3-polyprenylbenzoate decarboxylase
MSKKSNGSVLVGVSGASGSIYAERLVSQLVSTHERVYLVFSETAEKVVSFELSDVKDSLLLKALSGKLGAAQKEIIRVFKGNDLFAPIASGSSSPDAMVIVPGSMGSMARICNGMSSNLLERAADVVLKQRRQLIFCPRETPLSIIHLKNMLSLAEAGAEIIPLMPAFYQKPKSIDDIVDFCVGRILEQLKIEHSLYRPWNSRLR